MGNGKHLEAFKLDATHFHPRRTHRHPWKRETSDIGPFLQKTLDRGSRHMSFDHITLNNRGMTRSMSRVDTTRHLHGIHVLGDMVINAESRRGDVGSPLRTAAATR